MRDRDIYAIGMDYVGNHALKIIQTVEGNPDTNFEINKAELNVDKRGLHSSVFSATIGYMDPNNLGELSKTVSIKYFDDSKEGFEGASRNAERAADLLNEEGVYPKAYFFERSGDGRGVFVVSEHMGDESLQKITKGLDTDKMLSAVKDIFPPLIRFQVNATAKLEEWLNSGRLTKSSLENLFNKRTFDERVREYLGIISEGDSELIGRASGLFEPIEEIYRPKNHSLRVLHGDPTLMNMIALNNGLENGEPETRSLSVGLIDAEPILGDSLSDLGALLATPNMNLGPTDWYLLTDVFKSTNDYERGIRAERGGESLVEIRRRIVPRLRKMGVKFSRNESPGSKHFFSFGSLFLRALRIRAKVKSLKDDYPEKYEMALRGDQGLETTDEDMRRVMSLSLGEIVKFPGKFEVKNGGCGKLRELHELLRDKRLIKERCFYLKSNVAVNEQKAGI